MAEDNNNNIDLKNLAKLGMEADPNSITLDPAKALDWWNEGRRWRGLSVFVGFALMWLPFAGLYAMVHQFVPQQYSILNTFCPGALIGASIVMTLTVLKRPAAFVLVLLYFLGLIFGYVLLFVWLMNLSADRSTQFIIGFVVLAVAVGLAMASNRILKIMALWEVVNKKA